ncbi:MAG: hypothetical protein ABRQ39_06425 [Candidatus Eremiobacterota bacterium]
MAERIFYILLISLSLSLLNSCGAATPDLPAYNTGDAATEEELQMDRLFPSQSVSKWIYKFREVKYSNYYDMIIYEFNSNETREVLPSDAPYVAIRQSGEGYFVTTRAVYKKTSSALILNNLKYEYESDLQGFNGMLLYLPVQLGFTWKADLPFQGHDYYLAMEDGENRISTISDIAYTPAGTFNHCVRTDFTASGTKNFLDTGSVSVSCAITSWYAPDVGLVKSKSVLNISSYQDSSIDERIDINRELESYE